MKNKLHIILYYFLTKKPIYHKIDGFLPFIYFYYTATAGVNNVVDKVNAFSNSGAFIISKDVKIN